MSEKAKKRIEEVLRTQVKYLDLSDCELGEIPQELGEMPWLRVLHLSNNQIIEIKGLERLENLNTLWLSNNLITEIKGLEKLVKLKELTLFNNKITEVKGLEELNELTELWLHNNQITEIKSLEKLNKLTELRLDNNQIIDIYNLLPLIKQIDRVSIEEYNYKDNTLHLHDNPLINPPIEIVARGRKETINYFKTLEEEKEEKVQIFEAKMLVLGSGGVGKTSLSEKIIDMDYELKSETLEGVATEGIDILNYNFPIPENKEFKVNIWDFGGQSIYHATHQFFLTKRSLYILMTDTRKEDDDLPYWLNIQKLLAGDSPMLIVQNEKHNREKALKINEIRSAFKNVKNFLVTNLKDNRGMVEIVKAVQGELQQLKHIGSTFPKSWVDIRRELESIEDSHISKRTYFDICKRYGIKDKVGNLDQGNALLLSSYLHDLGVILHFSEDPILNRIVILDNEWATDAVYKVLDSKKVKKQWGRFSFDDLETIWIEGMYEDKQVELVTLMKKFKLCFELKDRREYIAPQLLPADRPDYDWGESQTLQLKYDYEFMPKGILARLIVEMHTYIKDQLIWNTGGVFEKDASIAEALEVYGKNEISIRIKGESQEAFRSIIMNEIDLINAEFQNLTVKKLVPCNCKRCRDSANPVFHTEEKLVTSFRNERLKFECDEPPFNMVDVLRLLGSIGTQVSKGETEFTKRIKSFIEKGKIVEALTELVEGIDSEDVSLKDEAVQQSSIFNSAKEDFRRNIIKREDFELTKSQAIKAILEILTEIEAADF